MYKTHSHRVPCILIRVHQPRQLTKTTPFLSFERKKTESNSSIFSGIARRIYNYLSHSNTNHFFPFQLCTIGISLTYSVWIFCGVTFPANQKLIYVTYNRQDGYVDTSKRFIIMITLLFMKHANDVSLTLTFKIKLLPSQM